MTDTRKNKRPLGFANKDVVMHVRDVRSERMLRCVLSKTEILLSNEDAYKLWNELPILIWLMISF